MRFIHTSDLHIGKTIESWDLLEDTEHVLKQLIDSALSNKVNCVLISGDIFDRSLPSEDAVKVYDWFLGELTGHGIKVIAIAGNHDSGIRVSANAELLARTGLYYVAGEVQPSLKKVTLNDEYGPVDFYLCPYFKPVQVANLLKKENSRDYTDDLAFQDLLGNTSIDPTHRNVILAHLFAAGYAYDKDGSDLSYSNVAGLENVAVNRFDAFDYVALGHIHRPQKLTRETLRYSGSLLKYKISEVKGPDRSFCLVDMGPKGDEIKVQVIPVKPLYPVIEISDTFDNLIQRSKDDNDFVYIHLLDTQPKTNAKNTLSGVFSRILHIDYPNIKSEGDVESIKVDNKTPMELVEEFYRIRKGEELSDEDRKLIEKIFEEIKEEDR